MSTLDAEGREIPDQTPIVIRVKNRRISQWDDVRAFIRNELSNAASNSGAETFEEANDFYMEDDPSPPSPWEYSADQEAEDREALEEQAQRSFDLQRKLNDPPPGGTPAGAPPPASSPQPPGKPGDSSST